MLKIIPFNNHQKNIAFKIFDCHILKFVDIMDIQRRMKLYSHSYPTIG
jgi:hypothetical protein